MRRRIAQTGQFTAKGTDGRAYTVLEYTTYLDAGHGEEVEGLKELRTADGHAVTPLEKGRYQVVHTGAVLTSSDPGAP